MRPDINTIMIKTIQNKTYIISDDGTAIVFDVHEETLNDTVNYLEENRLGLYAILETDYSAKSYMLKVLYPHAIKAGTINKIQYEGEHGLDASYDYLISNRETRRYKGLELKVIAWGQPDSSCTMYDVSGMVIGGKALSTRKVPVCTDYGVWWDNYHKILDTYSDSTVLYLYDEITTVGELRNNPEVIGIKNRDSFINAMTFRDKNS